MNKRRSAAGKSLHAIVNQTITKMEAIWEAVDNAVDKSVKSEDAELLFYEPVKLGLEDRFLAGSKNIVSVGTPEAAMELANSIREALDAPDLHVRDAKTGERRPYKIKIKIIQAEALSLTISDAYRVGRISLKSCDEYISEMLQRKIMELGGGAVREKELQDALNIISRRRRERPDHIVVMRTNTGLAYRVTYYNNREHRRKQLSVGDVLIVVDTRDDTRDSFPLRRCAQRGQRNDSYESSGLLICEFHNSNEQEVKIWDRK